MLLASTFSSKRPDPSDAFYRFLKHRLEGNEVFILREDWHPGIGTVQNVIHQSARR